MRKFASSLLLAGALFGASALSAAGAKTYQVTGPVMDVQGDVVTIQKGKDLWQINLPAGTTAPKKGDKVTITYTMTATSVEVKGAKAEKPAKKATTKKAA
ncbi:MAG TPA: hypothetical protein VFF76_10040 [Holophagaceae bacterium]|jgi:hypothetical protein|nr:hypothetical protein [Holophagaceae bacterium]